MPATSTSNWSSRRTATAASSRLSSDIWVDVGAYSTYLWSAGMEPLQTAGLMPGPYKIGAMRYRTRGVATNKTPVGPYRAVGRPSASASLELLIDEMARRLKLDPVEVRLRNLIPIEAMPYRNANNLVHDNVNYVPCLKLSVLKSDYERQRASSAKPVPMASSAASASPASRSSPASAPARRSVPARCCSPAATPPRSASKRPAFSPSPRRCRRKASGS